MSQKIGFIGQGWIGRHYADEFERRGYEVVRYSLDPLYSHNREAIADCPIVFIAVPTPTTESGYDDSIVRETLALLAPHSTAVIKSTLLPGTTKRLQTLFPNITILHSPEFLVEATAAFDAANPLRNIIGVPEMSEPWLSRADEVMSVLPHAPYKKVMDATTAELTKYAGNGFLYIKVLYMNILYDLASASGVNWDELREALIRDPRIGESHTNPVHSSGRGAGGHCFIKDFEALRQWCSVEVDDEAGQTFIRAAATYNVALLRKTGKDLNLLEGVYGKTFTVNSGVNQIRAMLK